MPRTAKKSRRTSDSVIDKAPIGKAIARIIDDRGWTQTEAGYATGEAPSQISLITNGKLHGFSAERLLRLVTRLGHDVEIRVSTSKGKEGKVRLNVG